jgi:hypothetical protein
MTILPLLLLQLDAFVSADNVAMTVATVSAAKIVIIPLSNKQQVMIP